MSWNSEYDVCCGLENLPVFVENKINKEDLPQFQYSPEQVPGPGTDTDPSEVTFPGCGCLATSCLSGSCTCLERHGQMYDGNLRLRDQEENEDYSRPVFECNVMCRCSENCANRVVQRGLGFRLEVCQTHTKGWGLRTLEPIQKGRFVCEYAGEVIGFAEACRRQASQKPEDMNYIIAVKEHTGVGGTIETFVDPARVGNVGRFLNHSCQPNLFMVPVRVDSLVPRLALFAGRDIASGEELVFDYSGRYKNSLGNGQAPNTISAESWMRKPCYCGSQDCCGFLPLDISVINNGEVSN
ncbi:histone-lysine N-methyltransferase SETMAR [Lepisosteus oculatus]|uniref:histone-lysine N-methyltransferase SETMAR n=1 Tax=Lepisosteus oculatus TaxID=7918 RepID=UPI003723E1CD